MVLWAAIHSFYITRTLETWAERLEKDISDLSFICTSQGNFSFLLTTQYLESDPAKHTSYSRLLGGQFLGLGMKTDFKKNVDNIL